MCSLRVIHICMQLVTRTKAVLTSICTVAESSTHDSFMNLFTITESSAHNSFMNTFITKIYSRYLNNLFLLTILNSTKNVLVATSKTTIAFN